MVNVTIYDVARESGVAPSTVSKVIHKTGRISRETQDRVLKTMEKLNFRPNVVASALKAKRTYTVALLISDFTNPFCNALAKAVEDGAIQKGYNVLVASTGNDADRHHKLIDMLIQKQVDGYILSSFSQDDEDYTKILSSGRPIVLADRRIRRTDASAITSDNVTGGYLATEHLLRQGHRDIALLLEDPKISSSADRMQGYLQAYEELNLAVRKDRIVSGRFGLEGGRAMMRTLSTGSDRPTAIVAANDLLAIGIMQEAFSLGLKVPDDLSVVGYDDTPMSSLVSPALTTIHQPIEEMGLASIDLLLKLLNGGPHPGPSIQLQPHLVIRSSVRGIDPVVSR